MTCLTLQRLTSPSDANSQTIFSGTAYADGNLLEKACNWQCNFVLTSSFTKLSIESKLSSHDDDEGNMFRDLCLIRCEDTFLGWLSDWATFIVL